MDIISERAPSKSTNKATQLISFGLIFMLDSRKLFTIKPQAGQISYVLLKLCSFSLSHNGWIPSHKRQIFEHKTFNQMTLITKVTSSPVSLLLDIVKNRSSIFSKEIYIFCRGVTFKKVLKEELLEDHWLNNAL